MIHQYSPTPDLNPNTHIIDTTNQDLYHTTNLGDSLNNTGNIDPNSDHITIRITGVNDQVPNNLTLNEDPIVDSEDDNIDNIKSTGVEDHGTYTTRVEDYKPNNNYEPEHDNNTDEP